MLHNIVGRIANICSGNVCCTARGMKPIMVRVLGNSCSFAAQLLTRQLAEGLANDGFVWFGRNLQPKATGMYPKSTRKLGLSREPLPGHAGSCAWCEGLHIKFIQNITTHGQLHQCSPAPLDVSLPGANKADRRVCSAMTNT